MTCPRVGPKTKGTGPTLDGEGENPPRMPLLTQPSAGSRQGPGPMSPAPGGTRQNTILGDPKEATVPPSPPCHVQDDLFLRNLWEQMFVVLGLHGQLINRELRTQPDPRTAFTASQHSQILPLPPEIFFRTLSCTNKQPFFLMIKISPAALAVVTRC